MAGPKIPAAPDPSQAVIGGATADVANFPLNYITNSLAQTGGKATIGGKTYDFTGLGNADQSNQMSDQMAQTLLDIQNNYGADYIKQRLADLQQSDPAGYAARQQLFDSIQKSANEAPDRPLASDVQTQVQEMLQNAGKLDDKGLEQVQQGVRGNQVAKGIYLGNAPASQEAGAVVNASDSLRNQQQSQALSYLQSGTSPQDVAYRRIQQSLSNLGAFANGQTPEAQFGSLSAAGNGAAPANSVNYSNPGSIDTGSGITGLNFANSLYGQNTGQALNQANPWLSGLSLLNNGASALSNFNFGGSSPISSVNPFGLSQSVGAGGQQTSSFNAGSDFVMPN